MNFVSCKDCPLRGLNHFGNFTADKLELVSTLKTDQIDLPAGARIIEPGKRAKRLFTLLSGWALRYRMNDAGARKVLEVLLPGSLIGLQNTLQHHASSGAVAVTPVTLCVFDGNPLDELFEELQEQYVPFLSTMMEDQRRADVRAMQNAKHTASVRLAYFLLDSYDRLAELGQAQGGSAYFPLQRRDFADILGLSDTHVSRSTAELSERGLATMRANSLTIHARQRMAEFAGYLSHRRTGKRFLL